MATYEEMSYEERAAALDAVVREHSWEGTPLEGALPCPFCGGEPTGSRTVTLWVRCEECGCDGEGPSPEEHAYEDLPALALANWNRRFAVIPQAKDTAGLAHLARVVLHAERSRIARHLAEHHLLRHRQRDNEDGLWLMREHHDELVQRLIEIEQALALRGVEAELGHGVAAVRDVHAILDTIDDRLAGDRS